MMYECDETEISKIRLEVRRPQEGKTVLCINHIIQDKSNYIHLVLTMNTIASSLQFLGRMKEEIGRDRIVILNSKKKLAGDCHHAKDIDDVIKKFISKTLSGDKNIKVVVACCHSKRFNESLPDLLLWAQDSINMKQKNVKFVIHIDEAHKYIPENINMVRSFNDSHFVSEIIGYTATPDMIWSNDVSDELFHKIFICDVDKTDKNIINPKYFGVECCEIISYDYLVEDELVREFVNITDPEIPISEILIPETVKYHFKNIANMRQFWYHKNSPFTLGDELTLISFINYILPTLSISHDCFSYNFIPAYTRKATHYQTMELIHKYYPTSNVIVINGDGIQLFRLSECGDEEGKLISQYIMSSNDVNEYVKHIKDREEQTNMINSLLEPSFMIEYLIKNTRDLPTFVTGFESVGMSVTLINKSLGNFDNVFMAHQQYSRDKLYQLCRFLFNYGRWENENILKIKRTKIHTLRGSVTNTCLEYEKNTRRLYMEFGGKSCTLREVRGLDPLDPSDKEIKSTNLKLLRLKNPEGTIWKKFKVYDGNDDEQWENAIKFYQGFRDKKIDNRSIPKRVNGYYHCSDSKGVGLKTVADIRSFEKNKWYSRFQLYNNQLKYARLFVGYDSVDEPSEYTIYVKYIELDDSPENLETLKKYCEKSNRGLKGTLDDDRSDCSSEFDLDI